MVYITAHRYNICKSEKTISTLLNLHLQWLSSFGATLAWSFSSWMQSNTALLDARLRSQGLNESLWHCWIILWHQCISLMIFVIALTLWVHAAACWWVSQLLHSDLWNKDATVTETRSLWNVPAMYVQDTSTRLGNLVALIFAFLLLPLWACFYFSVYPNSRQM